MGAADTVWMVSYTRTMALNIRNQEAEELAAELAKATGETKTEAVTKALRDRVIRVRSEHAERRLADELEEIAEHCATLPVLDGRVAEQILAYDEHGTRTTGPFGL
jgi:antitoxin VapB